jgi:hypothetical protein
LELQEALCTFQLVIRSGIGLRSVIGRCTLV